MHRAPTPAFRTSERYPFMPTMIPQPTLPLTPPFEKEDKREEDRQNEKKLRRKEEGVQHMTDNVACKTGRKGTGYGRPTRLAEHGTSTPKRAGRFEGSAGPQASRDAE